MADKIFDYDEESQSQRLMRKTQESPFVPIGMFGMFLAVCYGGYMYKHRGKMSTSIYLMQLRVAAQGTAVGTLTIGMVYNMYTTYMEKHSKPKT
ncbi:HIG1 domain family member 1A, mitochondrial-like [Arctopsyche grandis]|uniref:HIG1 domain family member 1A, mitochondrial-like n=1 Tax=Arctopsyche grandis TaxID=121162 RepID=UPI00406D7F1A